MKGQSCDRLLLGGCRNSPLMLVASLCYGCSGEWDCRCPSQVTLQQAETGLRKRAVPTNAPAASLHQRQPMCAGAPAACGRRWCGRAARRLRGRTSRRCKYRCRRSGRGGCPGRADRGEQKASASGRSRNRRAGTALPQATSRFVWTPKVPAISSNYNPFFSSVRASTQEASMKFL